MSDTNNRNKQGPGLQSVRGDEGGLPDRGTATGQLASYPGTSGGIDETNSLGGFSADSDPASPGKDMPNKAEKFSGGSHDSSMGTMAGLGNTDSDPAMDVTPGDENTVGDRD